MKHGRHDLAWNRVQDLVRYYAHNGKRLIVFFIAIVIANQVFAASEGSNAELIFIETFSGNNNNPVGLSAISLEIGLAEGQSLKDHRVSETGSAGGTDNGFTVTPTSFKEQSEAIAGEWRFDPDESSFASINYLIVKAGNQYSLYQVAYPEGLAKEISLHGTWSTFGLGKHAMSHVTAYSVPVLQTPIPAAGLLFGSAILSIGLIKELKNKR